MARLSIVIPTLDAAATLERALDVRDEAVAAGLDCECVVADGGSRDATRTIAAARGARVIETGAGRGGQLARGAERATGDWLLFLHADTSLEPGWARAAADFMERPGNRARAAAFRFALDDPSPAARRLERLVAWRCAALGLPYGDQGLLIAREFYRALGGFPALPLMEDVALVRRIGRARLELLAPRAITSPARYRRDGWLRRPARNLSCLMLYFLGVPARLIRRLYA